MIPNPSIEAFVLAGGKSSRMGQDKGLMLLNGKPMVSYVLNVLEKNKIQTSIIANDTSYQSFGLFVYPDVVANKGPMGGLYTAMEHSTEKIIMLVSCDMPLISERLMAVLLENAISGKIVVPVENGRLHPLFALYPSSFRDRVSRQLETGDLKMTDFILKNPHSLVSSITEEFPGCFRNINTPTEFKEIEHQCKPSR